MTPLTETTGRDDFLLLLTSQLRYQDPLNPLESTEFTAQLAQFSSLEQLINISQGIAGILTYQDSINNALATNLIGRVVVVGGDRVYLNGSAEISYELPGAVSQLKLKIYDSTGRLVRTVELGPHEPGRDSYTWDGRDDSGKDLPEGVYSVEFEAVDAEGKAVTVTSEVRAKVTGIAFEEGITYLVLDNGMRVSLSEIKEIWEGGV